MKILKSNIQENSINLENLQHQNTILLDELESLRKVHRETEYKLVKLQNEVEDVSKVNFELIMVNMELGIEKVFLKSEIFGFEGRVRDKERELLRIINDGFKEKECLEVEIYEGMREREELVRRIIDHVGMREKEVNNEDLLRGFDDLSVIKECLMRVNEGLREEDKSNFEEGRELRGLLRELGGVSRIAKRVEENWGDYRENEDLLKEIEDCKMMNSKFEESFSRGVELVYVIKEALMRVMECLNEDLVESEADLECEEVKEEVSSSGHGLKVNSFCMKLDFVTRMVKMVEDKLNKYKEKVNKEMKDLETSVQCLSEENRDFNGLLRIALAEKEAVEKKLKGNNEQKKGHLLQYAERGLQRVGFGFFRGGASNEQQKDCNQASENMACNSSTASDVSSECEEEVVSLASAVDKLMKNLRLEIAQLRSALEETRSDCKQLQSLTEKQALQITEQTVYIKQLEDRERILTQNVDELITEIKSTEEDVERWREACQLEAEAGKRAVEECDNMVEILKQELEKTRAALQLSNNKLNLKEELVAAAMAAQSAAERSLQLADSRDVGLRERIEQLTKQLEEAESREKNSRSKLSRICWPWLALKVVRPPAVSL